MVASITPAILATGAKAAGAVFGGLDAMGRASAVRQQEEINSEIGLIRADETDASARFGLEDDLSNLRAVLSANDARASVANLGLLNSVRQTRERERRIGTNNAYSQADDAKRRAKAQRPGMALAGGIIKATPSVFDLYGELR